MQAPLVVHRTTILEHAQLNVVGMPDGQRALQILLPAAAEMLVLPMPLDAARQVGHALSAPGVVVPNGAQPPAP